MKMICPVPDSSVVADEDERMMENDEKKFFRCEVPCGSDKVLPF